MAVLLYGAVGHAQLLLCGAPLAVVGEPEGVHQVGVDALFDNRGAGVIQCLYFAGIDAFDMENLFERGDKSIPPSARCGLFVGLLLLLRGAHMQFVDVGDALLQGGEVGFRIEAVPRLDLSFHLGQGADARQQCAVVHGLQLVFQHLNLLQCVCGVPVLIEIRLQRLPLILGIQCGHECSGNGVADQGLRCYRLRC